MGMPQSKSKQRTMIIVTGRESIDVTDACPRISEMSQSASRLKEDLEQFRSAHTLRTVPVDGIKWEYFTGGSAKRTIVLLPGGSGFTEAYFSHFLELEKTYRVIAVAPAPVTTVRECTSGILAVLDHEGVDRFSVLGQSWGGMLAQVLVRENPDRIDGLILSHTLPTAPPGDPVHAQKTVRMMRMMLKLLPFLPWVLLRKLLMKRVSVHYAMLPGEVFEFWWTYFETELARSTKKELMATYLAMIDFFARKPFHPADVNAWNGQTLILESDEDQATNPVNRSALKTLYPGAQVHTFQESGHLAMIARYDEYMQAVQDFLAATGGASAL